MHGTAGLHFSKQLIRDPPMETQCKQHDAASYPFHFKVIAQTNNLVNTDNTNINEREHDMAANLTIKTTADT